MSKRELESKVEEQHKQILYYEKKLKDVVRAYKSLDSEKNALQTAVESFKGIENAEESPPSQEEADESTLKGLKDSLVVLTREKTRRENALQQDKKLLLQENLNLKESLKTAADDSEAQAEKMEKVIKELSLKVKRIEMDRERELTDHGNVLAEMQQRYAKEKMSAENAFKQISELYKQLQEKSDLPTQFRTREKELQDKVSEMKKEMEEWKAKAERSPTVQLLQDQMANMKLDLEKELEERLSLGKSSSSLDKQVNSRICGLEEATQRLTERVAECEREKYEALDKLKKSVDESNELKLLLQKAEEFKQHVNEEDATKQFVILGNSLLKDGIDIFDVLEPNPKLLEMKARLEKTTDDFEKYKLKAEAVLKSKTSHSSENVDHGLRTLVSQLHDKIRNLEVAHATDQAQYELTTRNMRERISELERSEEIYRNQMKKEMQGKISEMEAEMQKQRSRTLEILSEKEQELEATKSILISVRSEQLNAAPADPAQVSSRSSKRKSSEFKKMVDRKYSSGSRRSLDAISVSSVDLLGTSGDLHDVSLPHVNETRNIYYEDELAKKEKEIQEMRNSLHKFQYRIRELEQTALCKELANHELLENFKEQIRVLEGRLKLLSDGGELEYLRNIFVQYLSCNNNSGAKNILKAIGMVLKLSPTEMRAIDKKIF